MEFEYVQDGTLAAAGCTSGNHHTRESHYREPDKESLLLLDARLGVNVNYGNFGGDPPTVLIDDPV